MQALGLFRISKNTNATVSKSEGVPDGTWAAILAAFLAAFLVVFQSRCFYREFVIDNTGGFFATDFVIRKIEHFSVMTFRISDC